ncbi:hypothetical protein G6O69_11460 [Pseudenhygromyxa sp. WMMC2535]|uniref:hypothetical protein n=1 Tax=Pseudenhygromyxa sp. WMMC2535 TaxID=2712867 RepID=UPI001552DBA1|nr:hypothetical protein [Pseudenhygromyxa sp. WMMC2535]NVB38450.1 hypothetical protein [Pseudenhygromyxa sp. WMMC2535]
MRGEDERGEDEPSQGQRSGGELDERWSLETLADELEAEGLEVSELRELTEELALIERPPGLLRRVTSRAREIASRQWDHFVGELRESREAAALIATRVRGERELTDEEQAKVREQLLDLFRMFPAGLIVAANSMLPVPGTSALTPWILIRLGLMPSRWREAHLLDRLRKQREILERTGHADKAARIDEILQQLELEADEREQIARDSALLTHWDANQNGVWDEDERAAYQREVEHTRELARLHAARKRWFFEHEGEVFGAARLTEIEELEDAIHSLLVCFDGKTGWVAVSDIADALA